MTTYDYVAPEARKRGNKLFSLTLAVLLFLPAVPASAGDSAAGDGGIDLRLEQALALSGASFELGEIAGDADLATHASAGGTQELPSEPTAVDLTSLQDTSRMNQVAAEHELGDQTRGKRGFGRWLKKYWYIPVLAAGAAVALSGDDSDDPNEIDD